jgi:hypothetical protein
MSMCKLFLAVACGLSLLVGAACAADAPARKGAPVSKADARADAGDAAFKALDTDRNGVLSPQEFRAGYAGLQRAIAVEIRLAEQFRAVDANHDGAIDGGEYARLVLVGRLGKAAPPLSTFDANGDHRLGFGEYVAAVRRLAALQSQATAKKAPAQKK